MFQPFMSLVNLLSSYKAVHEIFAGETLPNKTNYPIREIPQSPVVSTFLWTENSTNRIDC